jgi:signal transduction histidine kinase
VYSSNLPDNLPQLWVDKRALKRVQLNILTNAIKFSSEGGKAALSAHPVT